MQLIGILSITAVVIVWAAIVNLCLQLISAPSDIRMYTGVVLLLVSIPAVVRAIQFIINQTKIKE